MSTTAGRRRYDNSRRSADAKTRRHRIIEAASDLFLGQGFGATSVDQIAAAAEVSAPTVYATFGSKAGLLARVIDVAVVGDHDAVPLADRAMTVVDGADTQGLRQFAAVAGFVRAINERVAPLIRVMEQAASVDPALQELRTKVIGAIRADCTLAVARYWRNVLRPGLSEDEAADAMAALISPAVYSTLTTDLGWSPDRYQQWLAHALPHVLLRPEVLFE